MNFTNVIKNIHRNDIPRSERETYLIDYVILSKLLPRKSLITLNDLKPKQNIKTEYFH